MIISTGPGQTLDVTGDYAGNPQAPVYLAAGADPAFGLPGSAPTTQQLAGSLSGSRYTVAFGDWFDVPDGSIIGQPSLTVPIFGRQLYLVLPNGSQIALEESEARVVSDMANVFRSGNWTYHDCKVRLTNNTASGLVALGLVRPSDVGPIIDSRPQQPAPPATTQQAVMSAATAAIILAVVGAAVWFLPKDIFR